MLKKRHLLASLLANSVDPAPGAEEG